MNNRSEEYYNKTRARINDLLHRFPNKYTSYITIFIEVLKQYQKAAGISPPESLLNKKHRLSDHAFCMALMRMYNVDLEKVKDRVIEDIEKYRVRYSEQKGIITTVLGG